MTLLVLLLIITGFDVLIANFILKKYHASIFIKGTSYRFGHMYLNLRSSLYFSVYLRIAIENYFVIALMTFAILNGYMYFNIW